MNREPSRGQLHLLLQMACATEAEPFWQATCDLLLGVAGFRFAVSAGEWHSPVIWEPDAKGGCQAVPEEVAAAREMRVGSVFNYLGRTMRAEVTHVDAESLRRTPFNGHPLIQTAGCDEILTLTFFPRGWPYMSFALYRNAADRVTRPDALAALGALYPTIERLVLQYRRLSDHVETEIGVADFLRGLPVGLAFFSWERILVFANDEGYRQFHVWNTAPNVRAAKADELRERFALPQSIVTAFGMLEYERSLSLARLEPMERSRVDVQHPHVAHLKAVASITGDKVYPFRTPSFVVRFTGMTMASANDAFEPSSTQLSALAELTPAERAVAVLAMRGHDNQTIASQLNREVSTVKDHLTRVYAKLGVKSRSQLANLRGSGSGNTP